MSRRRHAWSGLAGLLLVAGLVAAPSPSVADPVTPGDPAPTGAYVEPLTPLGGQAPGAYWTPERMEQAVPIGLDPDGDPVVGSGSVPRPRAARSTGGLTAPRSVGKLFFSDRSSDFVCSAATVNTASRNLVVTAGHCVNTGGRRGLLGGCSAGTTYSNFLFVPRYDKGRAPDGRWVGTRAIVHREWVENCDSFAHDNALVELAPRNGRRIVDVVGGNGLALGFPLRESGVRVWGWPAQSPYDGETVRRCVGETSAFGAEDAGISCDLTGGASGGPWFISMAGTQVGYIWAVTSRRTTSGPPYLVAVPLADSFRNLLGAAGAGRVVSTVAATSGGTATARDGRLVLRATPARVGRGQVLRLRARAAPRTTVVLQVRVRPRGAWRRVKAVRTDANGVADIVLRPTRVGGLRYRVRMPRRAAAVSVRVLGCPVPRDAKATADTACSQPTA